MLRAISILTLTVAACSYDFGGSTSAGGAGTTGRSASRSADVSSASVTDVASSAASTADASVSADASSSSGEPGLGPCQLADGSGIFTESFDDAEADQRWQEEKEDGDGSAVVEAGSAVIDLGDSTYVNYASKRAIHFEDCYVVVEEGDVTNHEIERVVIRASGSQDTGFVLRYVANGDDDPQAQGHIVEGGVSMGIQSKTVMRQPLMRLEVEGDVVRASIGSDGVTWDPVFEGQRAEWMDAPTVFVVGLVNPNPDGTGKASFDNVNLP